MAVESRRPVILLAFANDRDDRARYLRNLAEEARRLREALKQAEIAGLCEVVVRQNAMVDEILDVFQDLRYRDRVAIFHYGGHAGGYGLLLESATGKPAVADAGGLASFLRQQHSLQLVFLNGCSTGPQVKGLLDAGVAAVISTSQAIRDEVATEFAARFYKALGPDGVTIRRAFNEAAGAVTTERGGDTRAFFRDEEAAGDCLPWELRPDGAEEGGWSIPKAADDPTFGLPPLPKRDLPESPFLKPLARYTAEEAEVFFGRGYQIRKLYERATVPGGAPIILLYGQSGVGKSSLLDAGLLPRLAASNYEARYRRRDQQRGLLGSLMEALRPGAEGLTLGEVWHAEEGRLGRALVAILDQVEESITRPDPGRPQELQEFVSALHVAFGNRGGRPQGKLVLGFRKEWLAEINHRLSDAGLQRVRVEVFLEPLDRRGIIEAVQGPSRPGRLYDRYGLEVEAGLPEVIADDLLADPGSPLAPTLQVLLCKMWEQAREPDADRTHPCFDRELYQALSRQGLLLKDFLNQQIEELGQWRPEVVNSGLALDLLEYHTTPLGTARQRTDKELHEDYGHMDEVVRPLVQRCVDLYLLTRVSRSGKGELPATRLAHDTLALLVRERFDSSDRPGQRARRILKNRIPEWEGGGEGTPLDEADLAVVDRGKSGMRIGTPAEKKLIESSKERRDQMSLARRLAEFYQQSRSKKPQLCLLLAVEAVKATYGHDKPVRVPAAEQALWDALSSMQIQGYPVPKDEVSSHINALVLMTNDKLFTANSDFSLTRWDLNSPDPERCDFGEHQFTSAMASGGDKQLAIGTFEGSVRVWDPEQCRIKQELDDGFQTGSAISVLSFSCDGEYLAAGYEDGRVAVWNLKQNLYELLFNSRIHTRHISSLLFTKKGLVSGSYDGTMIVWKLDKNQEPNKIPAHNQGINALALTRDGSYLITGSFDQTAKVWDLREEIKENTTPMMTLKGHTGGINVLALSPDDGQYLVTAGDDCTARVWNLEKITSSNHGKTETEVSDFDLNGHLGSIVSLALTKDNRLITGSSDGTARVWDLNNPDEPSLVLSGHEGSVQFIALTQNDRLITATTTKEGGVARVWYLKLDQLMEHASSQAYRNLSKVEWQRYFGPTKRYQKTFPHLPVGEGVVEQAEALGLTPDDLSSPPLCRSG